MVTGRSEAGGPGRHRRSVAAARIALLLLVGSATVLAVASLLPAGAAAQAWPAAGDAAAGRQVFATNCAACHGPNAEGRGAAPSLVGVAERTTVEEVEGIIRRGRSGMPAFGDRLSDAEIADVVAFLGADGDDGLGPSAGASAPDGAGSAPVLWILGGLVGVGVLVAGTVWLARGPTQEEHEA